jgi:hypothetical protein
LTTYTCILVSSGQLTATFGGAATGEDRAAGVGVGATGEAGAAAREISAEPDGASSGEESTARDGTDAAKG